MGIPVPGETALLIGSVLAGSGHLTWEGVAVAGWAGAVLGDNVGYAVGRRFGRRLVRAPLLERVYSPQRLAQAEGFFDRHGWTAVFFGRFVALLRIFAGPLAGMHQMPWGKFVIANATGAAVWVGAVVIVGLLLGSNLELATTLLQRSGYAGLAIIVVVIVTVILWKRWRSR